MPHPSVSELHAIAIGDLSPKAAEAVSIHIEACGHCSELAATYDSAHDALVRELQCLKIKEDPPDGPLRQALAFAKSAGRDELTEASGAAVPAAQHGESRPRRLREYELLAKLGEGGMGTVYQARHTKLDKLVAVKVLPSHCTESPSAIARFEREMRAVGRLEHPNLIRAHDAGEVDGTHFIVMEYVRGTDLAKLVRRLGPLAVADACEAVRQAALGLAHAHEHGLVHRDIKPSNLILSAAGEVKILDLGLALLQGDPASEGHELTSGGHLMGTIDYMAPEQAGHSHEVDTRSDLYSLGATLYKLLTGQAPLASPTHNTPVKKVMALATETPRPIGELRPEVPAELAGFVAMLLAKSPAARPATALKVSAALSKWCEGQRLDLLASRAADGTEEPPDLMRRDTSHDSIRQTTSDGQPEAVVAAAVPAAKISHSRPRARKWIVATVVFAGLLAFGVWVIVKNNAGRVVGKMQVPKGGSATVVAEDGGSQARAIPAPAVSSSGAKDSTVGAAEWVLRSGGKVTVAIGGMSQEIEAGAKLPGEPFSLTTVNLAKRPVRDHDLARLADLKQLKSLHLHETAITDAGIKHLESLSALSGLFLAKTSITDAAFDSLVKLRSLRELSITDTKTTHAGWHRFKELPRLTMLHVAMLPFGDSDMEQLAAGQPDLETLNLWGTAITDAGTPQLAKLSKLRLLHLNFTKVTGRGLAPLTQLSYLETLQLPSQLAPADEAARYLSALPALQSLHLQNTTLTDEGLMFLARIKSLRELKLGGTKVTSGGFADMAGLTQLRSLEFLYPQLSDDGAAFVAQLPELVNLELGEVQSDKCLESLSKLPKLEELHLAGRNLTDAGLLALAEARHLKKLVLRGTRISADAVNRLRGALPSADIQVGVNH